jgi:cytochrome c-type biogenesis protein CcmF
LLWTLMLGLWTACVTWFTRHLPEEMVARVLGVMGAISTGFLLFMLLTSNPFLRLASAPSDGLDLNPVLQDLAMILHPPLLYMGYVGFSVAFAFAISALLGNRLDAAWARWSRPWATLAWMFLTCGIALGSFWAYYELAGCDRQTRLVQELDRATRDRDVLSEPHGSVPGAIWRPDVGARLRH